MNIAPGVLPPLPTILPNNTTLKPNKHLNVNILPNRASSFTADFGKLKDDLSKYLLQQSCGCENFLRRLNEVRRRSNNAISQKSTCVMQEISMSKNLPRAEGSQYEQELEKEKNDAKKAISNYIDQVENRAHFLVKVLSNSPWVSEITRIINEAEQRQKRAAEDLLEIAKKVPVDVNTRYAVIEQKLKKIEEKVAKTPRERKCF